MHMAELPSRVQVAPFLLTSDGLWVPATALWGACTNSPNCPSLLCLLSKKSSGNSQVGAQALGGWPTAF